MIQSWETLKTPNKRNNSKHNPGLSSTDTCRWGLMLFTQSSSAKGFIGVHPGLALMGGKGAGLRLFVRKGGQTQSLQPSQGSQICCLLHDNDCKPSVSFPEGGPHTDPPLCEQGVVFALVLETLLLQRESARSGEHSAYQGADALVRSRGH